MEARSVISSIRIWIAITDRERISPWEGLAQATIYSAARNGIGRGVATRRRTAPPLGTTGRLRPHPPSI